MSTFYTLMTVTGLAELTNAQSTETTVPFTNLAIGDGNGEYVTPLESMQELIHEVHRVQISSISVDIENKNWLVIEAVLPATVGGWTIREIGLIGGVEGNKLLAIGNFPETYKPLLTQGSGRDMVIKMIIQVSNASVVQMTIDPSVLVATNQSIVNAITEHSDKSNPHPQYVTADELASAMSYGKVRQHYFANL